MLNNEKWWIVINESKSVAVFFAEKNRIKPRNIIVNSHRVSWSNSDKYLGVVLYSKLTWIPHLQETVNKAMEAFISLAPLFHNKSVASLTKLRVFSAIIRSISTYILSSLSEDRPQHLQIIQGRFIRLLRSTLNIPWYIRNDQIRQEQELNTSSGDGYPNCPHRCCQAPSFHNLSPESFHLGSGALPSQTLRLGKPAVFLANRRSPSVAQSMLRPPPTRLQFTSLEHQIS